MDARRGGRVVRGVVRWRFEARGGGEEDGRDGSFDRSISRQLDRIEKHGRFFLEILRNLEPDLFHGIFEADFRMGILITLTCRRLEERSLGFEDRVENRWILSNGFRRRIILINEKNDGLSTETTKRMKFGNRRLHDEFFFLPFKSFLIDSIFRATSNETR